MPGITATRTYYPGDLIYTEKALAWAPRERVMKEQCGFCFKRLEEDTRRPFPCCFFRSKNYVTCSKCSIVKYCGLKCQEQDLTDHELECGFLFKKGEGDLPHSITRLLAKIILKTKGKDWKTITTNVLGTEASFEDVESHSDIIKENHMPWLFFKEMQEQLKDFIGEENMPEEEELIKIVGKSKWSTVAISSDVPDMFCIGLRKFDRVCIPNANLESCNTVMKIWAIKKIEPTEKITISKMVMLTPQNVRAAITEDCFEICKCEDCSAPYGESILTKVLDRTKAYGVIIMTEIVLNRATVLANLQLEQIQMALIERVLQDQEGVLAESNALHLKTLFLKGRLLTSNHTRKIKCFEDLERKVRAVFGEYYSELDRVYHALVILYRMSGDNEKADRYLQKLKNVEMHRGDTDYLTKSLVNWECPEERTNL